MRTGAASAAGARRHNENDVTMTITGLWRYGNWRRGHGMGCTALVTINNKQKYNVVQLNVTIFTTYMYTFLTMNCKSSTGRHSQ